MKNQKQLKNEFGIPLYIDKSNKSQLRERVRLLKRVVATKKPIGGKRPLSEKAIERAKMHVRWYANELTVLKPKTSKKKAA